jgi:diguanylate cyclase (GGDEF)-like protein
MVLLPDTGLEGARVAAEKIRRRIAVAPYYAQGQEIRVTASFGLACFDGQGDFAQLIRSADEALYEAKNRGRNQVRTALAGAGEPAGT